MSSPKIVLSPDEIETAKRAAADRAQERRLRSRVANTRTSIKVSTFPRQLEGLRDRLFERAKTDTEFLESVFTTQADNVPTDEETLQAVENRVFTMRALYPQWFTFTKDADAKSQQLRHDHDVQHGLIPPTPLTPAQVAAFARRRQEKIEREQRLAERILEEAVNGTQEVSQPAAV